MANTKKQNQDLFKGMHDVIINNRNANAEIQKQYGDISNGMGNIFRSATQSTQYLEYVTTQRDSNSIKADDFKKIQNMINKKGTQTKMMSVKEVKDLTQKVRLMKGNKELLKKGLCTQADIDSKAYLWVTSKIEAVKEKTALDKIKQIVKDHNIKDLKTLTALIAEVKFK
jgi:hypothetical protein